MISNPFCVISLTGSTGTKAGLRYEGNLNNEYREGAPGYSYAFPS